MSVAGFKVELAPSAHWSSAVLVALGIGDPEQLDVLAAVLVHFGERASAAHESPTRLACRLAVAEFGPEHPLSPALAAIYSGLLVQIPRGLGCPSTC